MKIVFPEINRVFKISNDRVNSLIIENQMLLVKILSDLNRQLIGEEGRIALSENDRLLKMDKNCELLCHFIPFKVNTKTLVTKLSSYMEEKGISGDFYESTQNLLGYLENYLYELAFDMTGDIVFSKLNLTALIRAVGVGFAEEYDNLAEKIVDYMELVREYDKDKLFVTLNIRDYISDAEMNSFINTVLNHNIKLFMIECRERSVLDCESRYIVDNDWCEIC